MTVLFLNENLEMTNIAAMTKEKVKKTTNKDLTEILNSLTKDEVEMIIAAIKTLAEDGLTDKVRNHKYQRIGHIIEMATYRIMQGLAVSKMEEGK